MQQRGKIKIPESRTVIRYAILRYSASLSVKRKR